VVVKLDISYVCMGNWVCTDNNYSGEPCEPVGIGESPKQAVLAYFEAKAEEIKSRTSAV
jgi:hypothetical protein